MIDKMEYYNERHEKIGYLTFDVTYNKGLFYQGELQGVDKAVPRNLLPFYKQKCPTYNLYNCLDSGNQGHTFNFVEDIYRDAWLAWFELDCCFVILFDLILFDHQL